MDGELKQFGGMPSGELRTGEEFSLEYVDGSDLYFTVEKDYDDFK